MKVYIAGPMRGFPGWNFDVFHAAAERWREAGHHAFNPAATFSGLGYVTDDATVDRAHLNHVIQIDLACLYAADAIALLPGWEKSSGSTVELALAQFLRMPVFDALTLVQLTPDPLPWNEIQGFVRDWQPKTSPKLELPAPDPNLWESPRCT